jgi:signal transduction histidine kinase
MTRRRWGLVVLAVAAVGYALGGEWQSILGRTAENHLLDAAVGLSFFGAGIVALDRKPGNRIGLLMVAYAATWFLGNWGSNWAIPVLPSLGVVGAALSTPFIPHIALSYPSGRVRGRFDRTVLAAIYAVSWGTSIVIVLTWDPRAFGCAQCPDTPAVLPSQRLFEAASAISDRAGIVLVPLFLAAIVMRWRRASPARRRELAPLWTGMGMLAVVYLIGSLAAPNDRYSLAYLLWEIRSVIEICVPIVFVWGLLSTRLARSAVGDLVVELENPLAAEDLHAALARTLGDRTLQVAYAMGEENRWVDASGQPVTLPTAPADDRTVTVVRRDAEPIAALVHDAALDQGLVRSVAAAAGMAIANERLRAEVRAQLAEVRASRQRIVEAGDRERRRVERNLHDGAQQRLVALSLSLAMLRRDGSRDPETDRALADASAQLRSALQELRELARGIHPAILTQEGLEAAVESLAERSSAHVSVTTALDGNLPAPVEATAYFVVCEALANVAKYADAHAASVDLRRCNGSLRVEVADDGRGGADLHAGSGLLGLQDRVAALGGSLHLESPVGAGTRLVAEIPVDG